MNYEIGGKVSWFEDRLQGSLALYRMEIRDLLVAECVGDDQFVGRNAGRTRHQGLELLADEEHHQQGNEDDDQQGSGRS